MKRIGIAVSGALNTHDAIHCVKAAEELGYESAWVTESTSREAFSFAQALASATNRIKVGPGIANIYTRPPSLLAMGAATLDEASGGRALLGLGTSNRPRIEGAHGLPYYPPLIRMREYVEIIRKLLAGENVDYKGTTCTLKFQLGFKPLRPVIPIYVAALRGQMIKLAVELGENLLLYFRTIEGIDSVSRQLRTESDVLNRGTNKTEVASFVTTAIAPERKEAEKTAQRAIAQFSTLPPYAALLKESGFGDEVADINALWYQGDRDNAASKVTKRMLDGLAIVGTPEEGRARVEEYLSAGVQQLIFYLHPTTANVRESLTYQIQALAL